MTDTQLDRIERKLDQLLAALPNKRSPKKNDNAFNPHFEAWWKIYPKKVGKVVALRAWNRIKHSALTPDHLISDVKKRMESDRQWIGGFIPNPATYLNQNRWNDEVQLQVHEQSVLPQDDNQMVAWAMNHNHRNPHPGESFNEYRRYLQEQVR